MTTERPRARRRWLWGAAAAVALVIAAAALVFQPWLLLVDVSVDDEIPVTATTSPPPAAQSPVPEPTASTSTSAAQPAAPTQPIDLLAGSFVSHEHDTTGSARVIQHADGSRQLAIEDLSTTNGPDVHVWLSAGPVIEGRDGWFTAADHDRVDLGAIKGNLGDQLYDIPPDVDLEVFRSVDLWCVRFSVSFGAAALM